MCWKCLPSNTNLALLITVSELSFIFPLRLCLESQVVIIPYVILILRGMEPVTSLGFRLQKKIFNLSIFAIELVDGKHESYQVVLPINTDGVK